MRHHSIISVKEARKLLGKEARGMTDEEILEVINNVHALAKSALSEAKKRRIRMKQDAHELAELIYDIYQDEKRKPADKKDNQTSS